MTARMSTKKSKNNVEEENPGFLNSFLYRIPVVLVLLLILFLWSSSTTIISGSIARVCVSSRKLNSVYCSTAGTQPGNFSVPVPFSNNTSKLSVKNTVSSPKIPSKLYPPLRMSDETTVHISSPKNDSETVVINSPSKENSKGVVKVASKSPVFGVLPTPVSVIREDIDVIHMGEGSDFFPFTSSIFGEGVDKVKAEEIVTGRKEVEVQMKILRSYIAKSKPLTCDGMGIYVYDLPPKFNKDLVAECEDMSGWGDNFCQYLKNDAMGEPIPELGKGWYNTYMYILEPIFHSHVLKHPCRVESIEDAKLFYVPFYGSLDIMRWQFLNVSDNVKDSLSKELVEWLKDQKSWKRHFGLDHVFVLGSVSWDFRRWEKVLWGSRLLVLDELQNPVKLLIERQAWEINDVGVPYPTHFHPSADHDITSWQKKISQVHRPHLISFAGAPRQAAESIRSILINQCTSATSNQTCKFFDCSQNACARPAPLVKLFMESEFCLQPPGDSPTRKSVFDSLVAGCIPVLFDPLTAYYQYPWHLPLDYRKYSVYIDQEEVRYTKVNVVERLVKIPVKERQEMRRYIIDELMPKLVYPHPNAKLNNFEGAVSISVNNLIQRALTKLP